MSRVRAERERGFTLIELLVVILIIGVLTAVAVPMFMNQRTSAVEATMQQDLKNAATILEGTLTKNQGKYPSALPDYSQFSEGNSIIMLPTHSNHEQACLMAKNSSYPDLSRYYSTVGGGMLPSGQTCEPTTAPSYASQNINKKVAIIKPNYTLAMESVNAFRNALLAQGYTSTNIKVFTQGSYPVTTANMGEYDTLIFAFNRWYMAADETALAEAFYDAGGRVIIDGNDNHSQHLPRWISSFRYLTGGSGAPGFTPVYNAPLSPQFPYTFSTEAFNSDAWNCVTALKSGTHALATSMLVNGTQKCITMAASSEGAGRMVYIVLTHEKYPTIEVSPAYAAISWINA